MTLPLFQEGKKELIEAKQVLAKFEQTSGLATHRDKSVVLPLGNNLGRITGRTHSFRWAQKDEAEKLLGVWVTPLGGCLPTWEKTSEDISGKVKRWEQKFLPTTARMAVVNSYTMPKAAFQAQVYPPPAKQRVGLLALETNQLKKHLMLRVADLPMGIETFFAHEKLLRHWEGKSARWKVACENFMKTLLGVLPEASTREAVEGERIVFNKRLLLNETTPVGRQQDAKPLWEKRLGDLVQLDGNGVPVLKDLAALERELEGKGAARLARRAFEAAP
ncbi:unnamed protein product [Closterium sp. NIES-65]|nr:unnamed protein product [Closterium sp. NIES-65]